ncbi:hypothetical protein GGI02_005847, partial [Coemansia sp. RSA 2322]
HWRFCTSCGRWSACWGHGGLRRLWWRQAWSDRRWRSLWVWCCGSSRWQWGRMCWCLRACISSTCWCRLCYRRGCWALSTWVTSGRYMRRPQHWSRPGWRRPACWLWLAWRQAWCMTPMWPGLSSGGCRGGQRPLLPMLVMLALVESRQMSRWSRLSKWSLFRQCFQIWTASISEACCAWSAMTRTEQWPCSLTAQH